MKRCVTSDILTEETYRNIYKMLDEVSPISPDFECGTLCGAACCCRPGSGEEYGWSDEDLGIYLLPGEEKILTPETDAWLEWSQDDPREWEFPPSWTEPVNFVRCKTPPECPRERRPIQCRTFPLEPFLMEDGRLVMTLNDMDLPYHCTIVDDNMELSIEFKQKTWEVWNILIADDKILDLVAADSEERLATGVRPEIVFGL